MDAENLAFVIDPQEQIPALLVAHRHDSLSNSLIWIGTTFVLDIQVAFVFDAEGLSAQKTIDQRKYMIHGWPPASVGNARARAFSLTVRGR